MITNFTQMSFSAFHHMTMPEVRQSAYQYISEIYLEIFYGVNQNYTKSFCDNFSKNVDQ